MKHGKYNLKMQVPHLRKLAERYRYKCDRDWTDVVKVGYEIITITMRMSCNHI